jgi:hypothetical protein
MQKGDEYTGKNYFNKEFYKQNQDLKKEFDIINSYIDDCKKAESKYY